MIQFAAWFSGATCYGLLFKLYRIDFFTGIFAIHIEKTSTRICLPTRNFTSTRDLNNQE